MYTPRNLPSSIRPMRLPSISASPTSWVTNTMVFPSFSCKLLEFRLKLCARDWIERAKGLVHQQNGRLGGERARQSDALPLAAGKFMQDSVCRKLS